MLQPAILSFLRLPGVDGPCYLAVYASRAIHRHSQTSLVIEAALGIAMAP